MNQQLIFIPVLLQMLLVFALFIRLGIVKSEAVSAGLTDHRKTALDTKAWPENVVKVSNNIANQFETPVLFYVLSLVIYLTESVSLAALVLTFSYVMSRYLHAFIHVTSNTVPYRLKAFLFGVFILIGLTAWLLIKLITLV